MLTVERALVTGVAGFIGSHLAHRLLTDGVSVVGIDSLTDYYSPELKKANLKLLAEEPLFEHVHDEIQDVDLDALLEDVGYVFHLAGQPGVRSSWGDSFASYVSANVTATQILLEATRRNRRVRRFVYASSSSVYGEAERYPTSESDLPLPRSPYGVTKLAGENLCGLYGAEFGVPTVSLRYFTVYGPRQRPDMAFTRFLKAALAGRRIEVYGDGSQVRDFTYVEDIVRANVLAATTDCQPGQVFNVSGGSNVSVNEVLRHIERIVGRPLDVGYSRRVPGDVARTGGAVDRILRSLGWEPSIQIAEGIKRQFDWISQIQSNFGAPVE